MRLFLRLVPILGLLLLSSCSMHGAKLDQAELAMPAVFLASQEDETAPLGRWWEAFDDTTLNALMEKALGNNLDVAQARARLLQLEAAAGKAKAALFPSITAGGKASRDHRQGTGSGTTTSSHSLSVAAAYEVDLWRKVGSTSKAARLTAESSQGDLKALYMNLSAQVAEQYFLAMEQRAQLVLIDRIIASLTDSLERIKRRYTLGLSKPLAVYQARQNLLQSQESRPGFVTNLAIAEHNLSILLGRFPERELSGSLAELPPAPAQFTAGLPAGLLRNRPDIEAAYLRLAARDSVIATAVADRFPSINLLANYGNGRSDIGTLITSGSFWSLAGELSQTIFDAGRKKAEVSRAKAVFSEELAKYRQTVLNAVKEVEDALVSNQSTESRMYLMGERVEATGAALRLANNDYFEGLSDYLPVLIAQQQHFSTESNLLTVKRQLLSDRISLARALGGNWFDQINEGHTP